MTDQAPEPDGERCIICSWVMPSSWPKVKITEEISGRNAEVTMCVPCQRKIGIGS